MISTHRSRLSMCAAVLVVVGAASVALAQRGGATGAVRSANTTLVALLRRKVAPGSAAEKQRATEVTARLRGFLDVDELGRAALVDHWITLTGRERSEYLMLLRGLIEANYIKGMRSRLRYEVTYLGEHPQGDRVMVSTEIRTKRKGRPMTIGIDYVLRRDGGHWRAVDVITDGVGLVENYRAQFNRIIAKETFEGLLRRMRKKLAVAS